MTSPSVLAQPSTAAGKAPDLADLESRILVCVARAKLGPVEQEALRGLLRERVDWARLETLALHHKLLPLLSWHLHQQQDLVPPAFLARLSTEFLENAKRVLALVAELRAVVHALDAEGILCVPYKGPALAADAYGNIALRYAGDLDVVVSRRDMRRVRRILRAAGYVTEHTLAGPAEATMERSLYHESFRRPGGATVEVHWGFTDKYLAFSLDLAEMRPRLRSRSVGGEQLPGFSLEDQLLILCVHGAKHRWSRLEWLASVAELVRLPNRPDWDRLFARARAMGSNRLLFLGLRLAHEILDAPLPPPVRRQVLADDVVAALAKRLKRMVFTWPPGLRDRDVLAGDLHHLRLNERYRDKLRFLLYRLTTPSQAKTWKGFQVGGIYLPLHVLARPFRGLRAALRRVLS